LSKTSIALLGTGLMGAPIGRNLLRAGHPLVVWNRTRGKAAPLEALGARIGKSPGETVAAAEVTIVILENGPVVAEVLFGSDAFECLAKGSLVIDMSSIAPDIAREHAARLLTKEVAHLDAPISGGPSGAEAAALAIMVGGAAGDFARAQPILEIVGRPTHVGPSGAGQFAKLCSQWIAATAMAAVAETAILATAEGVDFGRIRDALAGGFADSKILQIHGKRMQERDFALGGHVRTFVKDLDAAQSIAAAHRLDLPVGILAGELFSALARRGGGDYDIAALLLEIEQRNQHVRVGEGTGKLA
jgi:2-hydroxy-3-oxopropionate reductase